MNFINNMNNALEEFNLLKHPFYQAWSQGDLSKDILKLYAQQYYHHVATFPRYLSGIHSICPNIKHRQILLDNLVDEEKGEENHPELWLRFAESLGCNRISVTESKMRASTKELVDGYFNLVKDGFSVALGALYAYERQTPNIAQSKIDGLKKFYNIVDQEALKFFTVHVTADEWHADECADILSELDHEEQDKASAGAVVGAQLLWNFLDDMQEMRSVV